MKKGGEGGSVKGEKHEGVVSEEKRGALGALVGAGGIRLGIHSWQVRVLRSDRCPKANIYQMSKKKSL